MKHQSAFISHNSPLLCTMTSRVRIASPRATFQYQNSTLRLNYATQQCSPLNSPNPSCTSTHPSNPQHKEESSHSLLLQTWESHVSHFIASQSCTCPQSHRMNHLSFSASLNQTHQIQCISTFLQKEKMAFPSNQISLLLWRGILSLDGASQNPISLQQWKPLFKKATQKARDTLQTTSSTFPQSDFLNLPASTTHTEILKQYIHQYGPLKFHSTSTKRKQLLIPSHHVIALMQLTGIQKRHILLRKLRHLSHPSQNITPQKKEYIATWLEKQATIQQAESNEGSLLNTPSFTPTASDLHQLAQEVDLNPDQVRYLIRQTRDRASGRLNREKKQEIAHFVAEHPSWKPSQCADVLSERLSLSKKQITNCIDRLTDQRAQWTKEKRAAVDAAFDDSAGSRDASNLIPTDVLNQLIQDTQLSRQQIYQYLLRKKKGSERRSKAERQLVKEWLTKHDKSISDGDSLTSEEMEHLQQDTNLSRHVLQHTLFQLRKRKKNKTVVTVAIRDMVRAMLEKNKYQILDSEQYDELERVTGLTRFQLYAMVHRYRHSYNLKNEGGDKSQ